MKSFVIRCQAKDLMKEFNNVKSKISEAGQFDKVRDVSVQRIYVDRARVQECEHARKQHVWN